MFWMRDGEVDIPREAWDRAWQLTVARMADRDMNDLDEVLSDCVHAVMELFFRMSPEHAPEGGLRILADPHPNKPRAAREVLAVVRRVPEVFEDGKANVDDDVGRVYAVYPSQDA